MECALPGPSLVTDPKTLREAVQSLRAKGQRVGLVPTMGALHAGHLSLVRRSRCECDATVVTIFVNPTQFGPKEDLAKYPRTLRADIEKLTGCGAQWVFTPTTDVMYPAGYDTWVEVGGVALPLEGTHRPGHFRGVATVVLKLFNMAGADIAYFGQKDYQQVAVIRRMVDDLNVPVEIRVCPTVREPDGLAMSSRNIYLDPAARRRALVLFESLGLAQQMLASGERDAKTIHTAVVDHIRTADDAQIDYVALCDPDTLSPVDRVTGRTLLALAVRIGGTRLIDNALLDIS